MIQITIRELIWILSGGLGITILLAAIIRFVASTWVKARIEASVKAEYDRLLEGQKHELNKKLEDYKNDIKIRDQAAKVAEFLAFVRWNQKTMSGEQFDRRAWELGLWLPTGIYIEVAKCLVGTEDAKHMKQILIEVRKHLLKEDAGTLSADNLLHFANPEEKKQ